MDLNLFRRSSKAGVSFMKLSFTSFSREPTQNSLIERFNRTFRTDFLDIYLFENLQQMRNYAEVWMWKYNNERPHSALMYLTPRGFLLKYGKLAQAKANEFPTFQQNLPTSTTEILTKNSTFEC